MKEEFDDFMNDLRSEWQTMPTPEFEDAEQTSRDAETQACIDWMQSAWNGIEIPEFKMPQRRSFFARWSRVAGAAAAIVITAFGIWAFSSAKPKTQSNIEVAVKSDEKTPVKTEATGALKSTVLEHGEIQLTKGRVRLILVKPTTIETEEQEIEK